MIVYCVQAIFCTVYVQCTLYRARRVRVWARIQLASVSQTDVYCVTGYCHARALGRSSRALVGWTEPNSAADWSLLVSSCTKRHTHIYMYGFSPTEGFW